MKLPDKPPAFEKGKYEFSDILQELESLGKFEEFFDAEGNSYPYWEKWKYKAKGGVLIVRKYGTLQNIIE